MGKFYLYDGKTLLGTGECQDGMEYAQATNGESVGIGDPPSDIKYPDRDPLPYTYFRVQDYPSIGEQFDLLWHAMKSGEIPMAKEFFDRIAAVKDKYPKE
jgi:hypothetical protein